MGFPRPASLAPLRALALLAVLGSGVALAAPSAAGSSDVCKPDPECRPICRAKARALFARCAEQGGARDECRSKARELRSACSVHECGGSCERACALVGQKLLQGCIEGGGALESCRAQADAASAACVEKRCRPCLCPQLYAPVCGVDGVTYGNRCEAGCAGVEVSHEGACKPTCPPVLCDLFCEHGFRPGPDGCPTCACNPAPGCDSDDDCEDGQTCHQLCSLRPCPLDAPDCAPCVGVCLPRPPEPCVCPELYQPVCGVDGKTYSSRCHAGCAGVAVAHEGECERECGRNADCGEGEVCHPPTGTCRPQCAIDCFRYDPVCGVDGRTYGCGEADAHCHGVEVLHEGECRSDCGQNESCPAAGDVQPG